ncbi:MAG: VOC family protein [Fimbriimonadales bacterium]|nr:VOC family protein [Fimbriimonadales bacterium]GBC89697.1 hypothetical protein HRbin14_00424 [bacterium HR14]GIV12059.1 MAG: hypothetical protein KatS3mg021_0341 [Fimbriimonadales bacterium]CUU02192.1 Glyoxalase-like domain-containing protein [Armatimonadetes bacterium GBS]CUU36371.1 Glyoxalase-like domain-containing protein [Armatimonadetes bacterium GXS]
MQAQLLHKDRLIHRRIERDRKYLGFYFTRSLTAVAPCCDCPHGAIVSFRVPDIHATTERARTVGFRVTQAPWREPFGWLATLQDPWGNVFHLHQPAGHP